MKYLIVFIMIFLPLTSFADFDTNLKLGSKGEKVVELQNFLTDEGLFFNKPTGNFFEETKNAVIQFQLREEIEPASGYFYSKTRAKANEIVNTPPPPAVGVCDLNNYQQYKAYKFNNIYYDLLVIEEKGPKWGEKKSLHYWFYKQ